MMMNNLDPLALLRRAATVARHVGLCALFPALAMSCRAESGDARTRMREFAPGIAFTNYRVADVPWSIHVVRMERSDPTLQIWSTHAQGGVGGIGTLTEQIMTTRLKRVTPLAGINGDFYARDRSDYTGDPRGLQIVDGDLISAPIGGVAFWIDPSGGFHATNVVSQFKATWPGGTAIPFGLNQARQSGAVLYTPAMGPSTFTYGGLELVLEPAGQGPWLPLPVGETLSARVRAVRTTGSAPLSRDVMVLSLDPQTARTVPRLQAGAVLQLSTATSPDLRGVKQAISGGPLLVNNGRVQPVQVPRSLGMMSYEFRSMRERHPRSALGWNDRFFFLIQVDGRQPGYSIGMTLEELGAFALQQLGCKYAMNLDGGVSSVLWADGRVRNSPAAGDERDVANALVIVRLNAVARIPGGGAAASRASAAAGE
jgi:hypothetical protein